MAASIVGQSAPLTAYEFYDAAVKALNADVKLTHIDDYDFLPRTRSTSDSVGVPGNDDG